VDNQDDLLTRELEELKAEIVKLKASGVENPNNSQSTNNQNNEQNNEQNNQNNPTNQSTTNQNNQNNEQSNQTNQTNQDEVIQRRLKRLDEFNKQNNLNITPQDIELYVPPIYAKKLMENEITFDDYLKIASDYIQTPKSVKQPKQPTNTTNLNKVRGGSNPQNTNEETLDYSKVIF